ncbi:hypothetical protein IP70_16825 [alpha proteobacterium AAP38]|nr:hypothetical protein IP70_16825 [alpha proteobacterium AAP38]
MSMHAKPAGLPVLLPRANGILTAVDQKQIRDFADELEEAVRAIEQAARTSSDVYAEAESLADALDNRSWWSQMTAGLSGGTDKELAIMVKGLGASQGVILKVVRLILKVMTQKNRVLQGFNEALVNKIAMVAADTRTLDDNQKAVVRNFLAQLQQQVFDQIQQQDMVDSHELRLIDHEAWREEKQSHDDLVSTQLVTLDEGRQQVIGQLKALNNHMQALADQLDHLAQRQTTYAERNAELEQQSRAAMDRLDEIDRRNRALIDRAEEAEAGLNKCASQISDLEHTHVEQKALIFGLEKRLAVIENIDKSNRRMHVMLFRYAPGWLAILLVFAAFYLSL